MRRKLQGILFGLIVFSLIGGVAHVPQAEAINVLGIETGQTTWEYNVVSFIPGLSFTMVSQADFATVNLNAFDVLFISEEPTQSTIDALVARGSALSSWLAAGHGVVALDFAQQASGQYNWLPDAVRPTFSFSASDTLLIADPTHPVTAGLTNDGLSGWNVSSHLVFTDTRGLDVLVTDDCPPCGGGRPVVLAGQFGLGRLVIAALDPDEHHAGVNASVVKEDQVTFVSNALSWVDDADSAPVTAPEPASLILFGSGLAGLLTLRRKYTESVKAEIP